MQLIVDNKVLTAKAPGPIQQELLVPCLHVTTINAANGKYYQHETTKSFKIPVRSVMEQIGIRYHGGKLAIWYSTIPKTRICTKREIFISWRNPATWKNINLKEPGTYIGYFKGRNAQPYYVYAGTQ